MANSPKIDLFERARSWLLAKGQQEITVPGTHLKSLLSIVVGVHICEAVIQSASPANDWRAFLAGVEGWLRERTDLRSSYRFACDAKLVLLVAEILKGNGLQAYGLDGFAADLAEEIHNVASIPREVSGEVVLLANMGYCRSPRAYGLDPTDIAEPEQLLRSDGERLRARGRRIAAGTLYGLAKPGAGVRARRELAAALTAVALQSLRDYDIALATVVIRTIGYLRVPTTRWLEDALDYLESQQQPDGRFGYFGASSASYGLRSEVSIDVDLYVPITVACLWTIIEARMAGFRLFRATQRGQA